MDPIGRVAAKLFGGSVAYRVRGGEHGLYCASDPALWEETRSITADELRAKIARMPGGIVQYKADFMRVKTGLTAGAQRDRSSRGGKATARARRICVALPADADRRTNRDVARELGVGRETVRRARKGGA